MNTNKRVIIVANRLPIKISYNDNKIDYRDTEGGLATGLNSVYKTGDNLWIGWPGAEVNKNDEAQIIQDLGQQNLFPVFLDKREINDYYEGFSNETIWPLFHYFPSYSLYNPEHWDTYQTVNQKFADAILKFATNDDIIWIHDYQLLLVPEMIRQKLPDVTIGFFLHIPFPSFELFRNLPWRKELLNGVLGADVVGFHTYDDVRHFMSATSRILNLNTVANEIQIEDRTVIADAFPISIDYQKYRQLADNVTTKRNERKLKQLINHNKLLISIDRLDYSKGIIHRLKAYDLLFQRHPELQGKITMIQLVVPSRDNVPQYKELKETMNTIISDINGRYSTFSWQPIQHFYRSFPIHLLSALYKTADVALVTPLRDGMNLVSKEYIASKVNHKGVLILSEMAGASRELSDALMVNPNDIWDFAEKIYQAINMPEDEQKRRMMSMQQTVSRFDIFTWVDNFMDKLEEVKEHQKAMSARTINPVISQKMGIRYNYASKRLIFLDYDGTLVPFQKQIDAAIPDNDLLNLLEKIAGDPNNKLVITSGRDYKTLDKWLGHLPVDMIAEHGAWYKDQGKAWHNRRDLSDEWKPEIRNILDVYTKRTPGTFVEEKSYSLAWHYRRAENGLGKLRTHELIADIKHVVTDRGLQILQGDKVLEIKNMSINKGRAARRWLEKDNFDFVMAIGDDHTDEDTFKAMPPDAITIKVGSNVSAASYCLKSYQEVRTFLQDICTELPWEEETEERETTTSQD